MYLHSVHKGASQWPSLLMKWILGQTLTRNFNKSQSLVVRHHIWDLLPLCFKHASRNHHRERGLQYGPSSGHWHHLHHTLDCLHHMQTNSSALLSGLITTSLCPLSVQPSWSIYYLKQKYNFFFQLPFTVISLACFLTLSSYSILLWLQE